MAESALFRACEDRDTLTVRILLKNGADGSSLEMNGVQLTDDLLFVGYGQQFPSRCDIICFDDLEIYFEHDITLCNSHVLHESFDDCITVLYDVLQDELEFYKLYH